MKKGGSIKRAGPDFAKRKDKAGAKKARRANETDTAVVARAVVLPVQGALAAATAEGTRRRLSLAEALSRTTHSSAHTRAEALGAVREALAGAQGAQGTQGAMAGAAIEACAALAADADKNVRAQLRPTLSALLALLDEKEAAPFMPLLVAYLCSGLTHLSDAVRADTVELAATLVERHAPLLRRHSRPVAENLVAMVASANAAARRCAASAGLISSTTRAATGKARVAALASLARFLRATLPARSSDDCGDSDCALDCADGDNAEGAWRRRLALTRPAPLVSAKKDTSVLAAAAGPAAAGALAEFGPQDAEKVYHAVHSGLLEMWIEASPSVVTAEQAPRLKLILETIDLLLSCVARTTAVGDAGEPWSGYLSDYRKHLLAYFPLRCEPHEERATQALVAEINALVCLVALRFLPRAHCGSPGAPCGRAGPCWSAPLAAHVAHALETRAACAGLLLPAFEALAAHATRKLRDALLRAFSAYSAGLPAASAARLACVRFVAKSVAAAPGRELAAEHRQWLAELPRVLWQLRAPLSPVARATAAAALGVLCDAAKRLPRGALDFLQAPLVPFLFAVVRPRASSSSSSAQGGDDASRAPGRRVFGPFLDMPAGVQRRAVFVLDSFSEMSAQADRAVVACCLDPRATQAAARLLLELAERQHLWRADPAAAAVAPQLVAVVCALVVGAADAQTSPLSASPALREACACAARSAARAEFWSRACDDVLAAWLLAAPSPRRCDAVLRLARACLAGAEQPQPSGAAAERVLAACVECAGGRAEDDEARAAFVSVCAAQPRPLVAAVCAWSQRATGSADPAEAADAAARIAAVLEAAELRSALSQCAGAAEAAAARLRQLADAEGSGSSGAVARAAAAIEGACAQAYGYKMH
eukprot:m51a1_g8930 hypothetical protein (885) ;mRNA; f:858450-861969